MSIQRYEDDRAPALRPADYTYPDTAQTVSADVVKLADWAQSAEAAYVVAQKLVLTSFVPEAFRGKAHEATAAILAGVEVGLSPMAALRSFDVIQGTAAPRANTLRALAQNRGHSLWVVESGPSRCVMEGHRRGEEQHVQRSVWTIERARQLKLTGKANWQNQPQAMLLARATSELVRMIASDAILGLSPYSIEELTDETGQSAPAVTGTTTVAPRARRKAAQPAAGTPDEPPLDEPPLDDAPAPPPAAPAVVDEPPLDEPADPITAAQQKKLHAALNDLGCGGTANRDRGLALISALIQRDVDTSNALSKDDASVVIDTLDGLDAESVDDVIAEWHLAKQEPDEPTFDD